MPRSPAPPSTAAPATWHRDLGHRAVGPRRRQRRLALRVRADQNKRVAKEGQIAVPRRDRADHQEGPHPLQPQRREERQLHLHRLLPLDLAPANRASRREADRPVKLGTIERPDGHGVQVTYQVAAPSTASAATPRAATRTARGSRTSAPGTQRRPRGTAEPAPQPPPAPENPYPYWTGASTSASGPPRSSAAASRGRRGGASSAACGARAWCPSAPAGGPPRSRPPRRAGTASATPPRRRRRPPGAGAGTACQPSAWARSVIVSWPGPARL